jgi:malonyl-CoA O-methyltransferase
MAPLVDMHDLGDMLVQAGFADPVMDQETLTLTWPDPQALLAELRTWGATWTRGVTPGCARRAGATPAAAAAGPGSGRWPGGARRSSWSTAMRSSSPGRPRMAAETSIPLQQMRDLVRGNQRLP